MARSCLDTTYPWRSPFLKKLSLGEVTFLKKTLFSLSCICRAICLYIARTIFRDRHSGFGYSPSLRGLTVPARTICNHNRRTVAGCLHGRLTPWPGTPAAAYRSIINPAVCHRASAGSNPTVWLHQPSRSPCTGNNGNVSVVGYSVFNEHAIVLPVLK